MLQRMSSVTVISCIYAVMVASTICSVGYLVVTSYWLFLVVFLFSNNQINKLISSSGYMDFALRPNCYYFTSNHNRPIPLKGRLSCQSQGSPGERYLQIRKPDHEKGRQSQSINALKKENHSSRKVPQGTNGRLAFHRRLTCNTNSTSNNMLSLVYGSAGPAASHSEAVFSTKANSNQLTDEDFRDDLVSWFVSFLKSISLRLSPDVLRFFYNEVRDIFFILENLLVEDEGDYALLLLFSVSFAGGSRFSFVLWICSLYSAPWQVLFAFVYLSDRMKEREKANNTYPIFSSFNTSNCSCCSMVRTHVRTITLNVLQGIDPSSFNLT